MFVLSQSRCLRSARILIASAAILSSPLLCCQGGTLELRVVDEQGVQIPCRIAVRVLGAAGVPVVPPGAVELRIGPERWFVSDGASTVELDEGRVSLRVESGHEFVRFKQTLDIVGPRTARTIVLTRWIDMRSRGYLCGESHLHVKPAALPALLAAEGLDFGTLTTWWNGPDPLVHVPPGTGRSRLMKFAGRTIPTSVHDAEVEHAWGALFLQNLPAPVPLETHPDRPNLDFARHAFESGGMVHYQGGWSREAGIDALLGYVHAVQLCGNNFQPHRFQPRSRNSNLLQVEGFPVYPDTDQGMLRQSLESYYRLLNWGLSLASSAGSSTDIKEVPAGYNRTYVRVPVDASLSEFYKEWSAGKNFVTNGPMLFLRTAEGQEPGDVISLPSSGGKMRVEVVALADQELTSVELVVNGAVAATFPTGGGRSVSGRAVVDVERGSWIAARCTARDELLSDDELVAYANGDKQQPSRLRFAHTSPIYVTVGGKRAAERESLDEGKRLLDRFEVFARQTAGPRHLPELQAAIVQARRALEERLRDAAQ